jgi:hypothetical protein
MTSTKPQLPPRVLTGPGAELAEKYGADWTIWADSSGKPVATRRKHLRFLTDEDQREQTVMADNWDQLGEKLAVQRLLDRAAET